MDGLPESSHNLHFSTLICCLPSMQKCFLKKKKEWINEVQSAQVNYEEHEDPLIRQLLAQQ